MWKNQKTQVPFSSDEEEIEEKAQKDIDLKWKKTQVSFSSDEEEIEEKAQKDIDLKWKKTQVPFSSDEEEIEEKAQKNIDLKWKKTQVPFFSDEEKIEEKAQENIDLKVLVVRAQVSNPVKLDHYRWIENYTNASFNIPGVHYDYLTKKIHYTQHLIINAELYPCKAYQFDPAHSSMWPHAPFNSFYQGAHAAIIAFDTGLETWEKNLSSLIEKVKSKIDVPIFLIEITANGVHQTVCNNEIKTLARQHGCSSTGVVNFDNPYDVENIMENTIKTIIKAYLAKANYIENETNDASLIKFSGFIYS